MGKYITIKRELTQFHLTLKELHDGLGEMLANGYDPLLPVDVGCGKDLHPIKEVYKDDAPFQNLNCIFIIVDDDVTISRPGLLG